MTTYLKKTCRVCFGDWLKKKMLINIKKKIRLVIVVFFLFKNINFIANRLTTECFENEFQTFHEHYYQFLNNKLIRHVFLLLNIRLIIEIFKNEIGLYMFSRSFQLYYLFLYKTNCIENLYSYFCLLAWFLYEIYLYSTISKCQAEQDKEYYGPNQCNNKV